MLLPPRAATLWPWHCEAPKGNKMIHAVLRARGGKRGSMRDAVRVLRPSPNAKLLAFSVLRAELCQITPLQPNSSLALYRQLHQKSVGAAGTSASEVWQRRHRLLLSTAYLLCSKHLPAHFDTNQSPFAIITRQPVLYDFLTL